MEVMHSRVNTTLAMCICACIAIANAGAQRDISVKSADSLIRNTKNILILDVRTPEEYRLGHIPDAISFDYYDSKFIDSISSLPHDAVILVYSRSGKRSSEALDILGNLRYSRIHNMLGGFLAWKKEGRRITKGR
jgi:phage shock protein E